MVMSVEDLEEHGLWQSVAEVREKLAVAFPNAGGEEASLLAQAQEALVLVERLRDIETWRFPDNGAVLSTLEKSLAQFSIELDALISDANYNITTVLNNRLNAISKALLTAPVSAVTSGHLKGVKTNVEQLNTTIGNAIADMRSKVEEANASVAGLEATREAELVAMKTALDELTAEIAKSDQQVTSQITRLESALSDYTQKLAERNSEWSERIGELRQEWREEISKLAATSEKKISDKILGYSHDAKQHLHELATMEKEARNLVNSTARATISARYGEYARRQGVVATMWSVAAVTVAIYALFQLTQLVADFQDVTVAEAIFKATATTAILATAGLMGTEARGHRREARDAKRTQLDLNALDPFLANLEVEERNAMRKEFAYRIFGRPMANDKRGKLMSWTNGSQSTNDVEHSP